jgi:hypothetical protein
MSLDLERQFALIFDPWTSAVEGTSAGCVDGSCAG